MPKIKVSDFGPIGSGYTRSTDGFFDIPKVTLLCGTQGSGKSSIAKLVSVFTWLEKALVRGDFSEKELVQYNRFVKKYCAYQNIHNYFTDKTELGFKGEAYDFTFTDKCLDIKKLDGSGYKRPKIMYFPAERNLMSAVSDPEKIRNLPSPLYSLLADFEMAKQSLRQKETLLPIGGVSFAYDKQNKISWIQTSDYRIRLQEASSGFQSLMPLFLVTQYLSDAIGEPKDPSRTTSSLVESRRVAEELERLLKDQKLSPEVREALLSKFIHASVNSRFVNIVEEPEQNLYPASQRSVLFDLLACMNRNESNSLLMTTHSPYMISWLTLAIKARALATAGVDDKDIEAVVPRGAWLAGNDTAVYQLSEKGEVEPLETYSGLPSDDNLLNGEITAGNELFSRLLDMQGSR